MLDNLILISDKTILLVIYILLNLLETWKTFIYDIKLVVKLLINFSDS